MKNTVESEVFETNTFCYIKVLLNQRIFIEKLSIKQRRFYRKRVFESRDI